MASEERSRQIEARLEGLMGRRALSTDVVEASVRELGKSRAAELDARRERQVRAAELREAIYAPIFGSMQQDQRAAGAIQELGGLGPAAPAALSRRIPVVPPWIYTSPITVTQTPPYAYVWNEPYKADAGIPTINLDPSVGTLDLHAVADKDGYGTADCLAGFGIYFYPPAPSGVLDIWTTPVASWSWKDWAVLSAAGTYGTVDLFVLSYDLHGNVTGVALDPYIWLWNDESTASETDGHRTDYAFSLGGQIHVDNSQQYIIWVRFDVDAAAYGHSLFTTAGAHAQLSGVIPSITWTFTGFGGLTSVMGP